MTGCGDARERPYDRHVLIAYVDESYNDKQSFYFIGAAVAEESAWEEVDGGLAALHETICASYGIPRDAEFHGHEIMSGTGGWSPLRGKHREANEVYRSALRVSSSAGVHYVFRGLDVRRLNARYRYPRPPHIVVMDHILERLDQYARAHSDGPLIVVADRHSMEDKVAEIFAEHQIVGTDGYRPSKLKRISAPLNFADSCQTPGLQAVDLALYVHQRCRLFPVESRPVAQRARARLEAEIRPNATDHGIWKP